MNCETLETTDSLNCSITPGKCNRRYAHDSIRTNFLSKLAMAYERDLGVSSDWSGAMRVANPVRSELLHQHMSLTREK